MKKPMLKLLGILSLFFIIFFFGKSVSNKNTKYLKNLNLKLKGEVINIVRLDQGHDYGIITLDVKKTSIKHYDVRGKRKTYFGVIKGDKAEIIVTTISVIKLNDEIIIEGNHYKILRKNNLIKEGIWDLPFDIINNPYIEISQKIKL